MTNKFLDQYQFSEQDFNPQYFKAFKGLADLYGINNLARFALSQVLVIGVGGVGSWAVESLARTGFGSIILIDNDDVCVSNINRQLPALVTTVGEEKTGVLAQRCQEINPSIQVQEISEFVTIENYAQLIRPTAVSFSAFSSETQQLLKEQQVQPLFAVLDAIDNSLVKTYLIDYCRKQKYKLVVCGAAGGKTDPCQIKIADITEASQDPMLANIRNRLRREFGYRERFKHKKFKVPVVYSTQQLKIPDQASSCDLQGLSCSNGYGSAVVVTAGFANAAVSKIVEILQK